MEDSLPGGEIAKIDINGRGQGGRSGGMALKIQENVGEMSSMYSMYLVGLCSAYRPVEVWGEGSPL